MLIFEIGVTIGHVSREYATPNVTKYQVDAVV